MRQHTDPIRDVIAHALAGGDGKDGNPSDWTEVAEELLDELRLEQVGWWDTRYERVRALNEAPTIDTTRLAVYVLRGVTDG